MLGVYVHFPFCEKKCNYCAFSSFVKDDSEKEKYISSLVDEINSFHQKYKDDKYKRVSTIYFGGGTPSTLSIEQFLRVRNAIFDNFLVDKGEFTIEVNPNSVTEEKLKAYREGGVNRISIGVQSLNDKALNFIGRLHNSVEALTAIKMAQKYFDNVSCDVIIGIPQTEESFISDIKTLASLNLHHISTYLLQLEEGTPLERMVKNHQIVLPDEDKTMDIYEKTALLLQKLGYNRYEVSNYAKEGYQSKHNKKYWSGEEYVGFGLGAHSFLNGCRLANDNTFEGYYNRKLSLMERLSSKEKIEEAIMLGLRCEEGVNIKNLANLGYDILKNENLEEFIKKDVIIKKDNKLYLNPTYYGVNNFIIASLMPN